MQQFKRNLTQLSVAQYPSYRLKYSDLISRILLFIHGSTTLQTEANRNVEEISYPKLLFSVVSRRVVRYVFTVGLEKHAASIFSLTLYLKVEEKIEVFCVRVGGVEVYLQSL
jgi:hypothetical protein